MKDGIFKALDSFHAISVTVREQSVYVQSIKVEKVISVFTHQRAPLDTLLQLHEYTISQTSSERNVKFGVESFHGVETGVTTDKVGGTES